MVVIMCQLLTMFTCAPLQDNYAFAHWGQTLAIQDCVYRAMAAEHRWVAVLDIDEYILPKAAATPNWHALLQLLVQDNGGRAAAEYSFSGVKMCSGCIQQKQQEQANVTAACRQPVTVGFHHVTWPSRLAAAVLCSQPGQQCEYIKTVVDLLAVGPAYVHSTVEFALQSSQWQRYCVTRHC
jgi:hypothetical protein